MNGIHFESIACLHKARMQAGILYSWLTSSYNKETKIWRELILYWPFCVLWFQMRTSASEYIWAYIPACLGWLVSPKLRLSNKLSLSHVYSKLDLLHDTGSCQFDNTKHCRNLQTEGSSFYSKCNTNSKRSSTLEEPEIPLVPLLGIPIEIQVTQS